MTARSATYVQTETIPMLKHEHSYGDWQKDKTQHWKECRCGKKTEVGNHTFDDWTITKEPTTTETGSRERTCSICKYTQTETLPVHTHDVHDEAWKYDETQHWQECSCGEKLNVANHTYGDWKVTKEATETEAGSRERGCAVCEYPKRPPRLKRVPESVTARSVNMCRLKSSRRSGMSTASMMKRGNMTKPSTGRNAPAVKS